MENLDVFAVAVGAVVAVVLEYAIEPWVMSWATMSANKKRSIIFGVTFVVAVALAAATCNGWVAVAGVECPNNDWLAVAVTGIKAFLYNQATFLGLPRVSKQFDRWAR